MKKIGKYFTTFVSFIKLICRLFQPLFFNPPLCKWGGGGGGGGGGGVPTNLWCSFKFQVVDERALLTQNSLENGKEN